MAEECHVAGECAGIAKRSGDHEAADGKEDVDAVVRIEEPVEQLVGRTQCEEVPHVGQIGVPVIDGEQAGEMDHEHESDRPAAQAVDCFDSVSVFVHFTSGLARQPASYSKMPGTMRRYD
jgi:hypothetical protein